MEFHAEAYKEAFSRLPTQIAEAEVNAETHDVIDIAVKDGVVSHLSASKNTALFVRVTGESTGCAYTEDLSESPEALLMQAYENSRYAEQETVDALRPDACSDPVEEELGQADPANLIRCAVEMEAALLNGASVMTDVHVSVKSEIIRQRVINSHGLDVVTENHMYIMRVSANAAEADKLYESHVIKSAQHLDEFRAADFMNELEPELFYQTAAATEFKPGVYPAVISRKVICNIFLTAWQMFAGFRCLNGTSPLAGKENIQVAADCVNITDYPRYTGSGFSGRYDCEGTPMQPIPLIKNGILTGSLLNRTESRILERVPLGCAGRRFTLYGNILTSIVSLPRNFVIHPGSASLTEMLTHMADGIYITASGDLFHTVDFASGNFSIPCKGVMVRSGKPAEHLSALTISGNLFGLLKDVQEVGSELYMGVMEEIENYCVGACDLRVSSLSVSG